MQAPAPAAAAPSPSHHTHKSPLPSIPDTYTAKHTLCPYGDIYAFPCHTWTHTHIHIHKQAQAAQLQLRLLKFSSVSAKLVKTFLKDSTGNFPGAVLIQCIGAHTVLRFRLFSLLVFGARDVQISFLSGKGDVNRWQGGSLSPFLAKHKASNSMSISN